MVLRKDNQLRRTNGSRRIAVATLTIFGIFACVDVSVSKSLLQMAHRSKITVIAKLLARLQAVQRMVEVVVPLSVQAIATPVPRAHETCVIEIRLSDQVDFAIASFGKIVNG